MPPLSDVPLSRPKSLLVMEKVPLFSIWRALFRTSKGRGGFYGRLFESFIVPMILCFIRWPLNSNFVLSRALL